MRPTLSFAFAITALCLLMMAVFIPAIHGASPPRERALTFTFQPDEGNNPIIPVTGRNNQPSLSIPECTSENHRTALLCGKDILQALFTEEYALLNLLLLIPASMASVVVVRMLRQPDSRPRKALPNLIAGMIAILAVGSWGFFSPRIGILPDIGYWVIVFATLLLMASVLLQGDKQVKREEILIQQRLKN